MIFLEMEVTPSYELSRRLGDVRYVQEMQINGRYNVEVEGLVRCENARSTNHLMRSARRNLWDFIGIS